MPRTLSIASPGNGSGKTLLLTTILRAHPGAFSAVKFTTVYRDGQNCPRTETVCACRSLHGPFTVVSDPRIVAAEGTDTGRMAAAGAARVLWCLSIPSAHRPAWEHLRSAILGPREAILTEGNRIVPVIDPWALVFVVSPDVPRDRWKDDTWDLIGRASLVVVNVRVGSDRPPAESLADEVRARTRAPVVVQDVSAPLASWLDAALADLAASVLRADPGAPSWPGR